MLIEVLSLWSPRCDMDSFLVVTVMRILTKEVRDLLVRCSPKGLVRICVSIVHLIT